MSDLLTADETALRRYYLFRPCDTKEELHDWVLTFLGLDLPDCIVDEASNSCPMDMVYEAYSKMRANNDPDFNRVLYFACRDGFKTLGAAIIEVLAIMHLRRSVAHMAAIEAQALKAQEYVKRAFRRPYIRDFVVGDNQTETKVVRFYNPETKHSLTSDEYAALSAPEKQKHEEVARTLTKYQEREDYIKVVICTMRGANSEHVPLFIIDEVDVVANPTAYEEAQNIPSPRNGILDLTILTSTRKVAFGLVQKEIDNATKSGLHVRHWNLIDITEACPPARHRPDLPRLTVYRSDDDLRAVDEATYNQMSFKEQETYVKDTAYEGCLTNCRLFAVCKGRLATHQKSKSVLLNPIPTTINKFKRNSLEMAKAQLMCWKPSNIGLIYGRFDPTRHILSPAQAYARIFGEPHPDPKNFTKAQLLELMRQRDVDWYGGLDWGDTHNFVYVHGFRDGQRGFITNCISIPELDPDQMLDVCAPFKVFDPSIYADTSDPKMTRVFKKYGYRMIKWKKDKGSVVGGINIVRMKLSPPMGDPELFFIHDINEDPGMELCIQRLREYHWKVDAAGKPTNIPDKVDDDEPDGVRYLVMNVFEAKGKVTTSSTADVDQVEVHPYENVQSGLYDPSAWARQIIAERTGQPYSPPAQERPRMRIEAPQGGPASYYGVEEPQGKPASGKKGKKGSIIWDIRARTERPFEWDPILSHRQCSSIPLTAKRRRTGSDS